MVSAGFVAPDTLRAGRYAVSLACTAEEVLAAQQLRYRVMYAESGGQPDQHKAILRADVDEWDDNAHHIIVTDTQSDVLHVLGTLRLVSSYGLRAGQAFYTEHSFDLSGLRARYPSALELGRFCVDGKARQGIVLGLIWRYAMAFIASNPIDVMLGCASFSGTNVRDHRDVLGYLYHHHLAPPSLRPQPKVSSWPLAELIADTESDAATVRAVPTLLRGYLKLGARISDAAISDPVFNTTFIAIYVVAAQMRSESTTVLNTQRREANSASTG